MSWALLSFVVIVGVALIYFLGRRNSVPDVRSLEYLVRILELRPDLQAFVSKDRVGREWDRVKSATFDEILLENGRRLDPSGTETWCIAYGRGDVMDANRPMFSPPPGTYFQEESATTTEHYLTEAELARGQEWAMVEFGPSLITPDDRTYYSTTLRATSSQKIRVRRFAGYWKDGHRWKLATTSNTFFTAEDFVEWYGAPSSGWFDKNRSPTDHTNFGGLPVLWAYELENDAGEMRWTGAIQR